ncbi:Sac2 family-domain-containing protein, partial [Zopfochytrium polystomum]
MCFLVVAPSTFDNFVPVALTRSFQSNMTDTVHVDVLIGPTVTSKTTARARGNAATDPSRLFNLSLNEVDDRIMEFQEDELVKGALAKGIDLREYAREIEKELALVEHAHVDDYVAQDSDFSSLKTEIASCDSLLESMESLLAGFKTDLAKISGEIQSLQEQSLTLTIKLKNRTNSQNQLNTALEGLVVSPDLIKKICEGEVNEFYLQHLHDLNKKMTYVKSQRGSHIRALKDVGPELERLRLKASEKIRDFLTKKIDSLKAPNTNICIIQKNVLLKYKDLYRFLLERYGDAAFEVRSAYIVTVGSYFFASFEKYIKSMSNLQIVLADKLDLIGNDERGSKRCSCFFSPSGVGSTEQIKGLFGKAQLRDKTNVFSLGERIQVLTSVDSGIILAHVAEEQHLKFPFEAIFKSINRLLMDNCSSEFIFTSEFFSSIKKSKMAASGEPTLPTSSVFYEIFDPTLKYVQAFFKQYIDTSVDAVGVLICIRLNAQHLRAMQKRRIPCLDNFMNFINISLWPRFQGIIDMHIDSLRKAQLGKIRDAHPHFIMRRYAEFAVSILTLNEGFEDALLINSLNRLRGEVENLLTRMADDETTSKGKLTVYINNYDLIFTILSDNSVSSFDEEKAYFGGKLEAKIVEFVDEEMKPHISFLMEFVERAELENDVETLEIGRFESIALQFNNSWKAIITETNASILQGFPNFQNGARILHSALTQVLVVYKRFLQLWEKRFLGKSRKVHPIGLQAVVAEIQE